MILIQLVVGFTVQLLQVAAVKNTISPSYLWPLRFIYNKKVPVVPPLDVHGDVTNDDVGLKFDGKTGWLDAGELRGSCIAHPQNCVNGLSVAMRAKITSSNVNNASEPRFMFDSGGFNGEGVSLYVKGENFISEVADKKRFWRVSSKLQSGSWHFILVTWSFEEGIKLFVDGPMKAQNAQPISFQLSPVASSNHVILGRCNAEAGTTFATFSSDLVAVFDSVTPDGKVYLSYSFSAPSTRGNIRYVNAKFINTADFDLMIFPDRGEHQKDGYQLEAHSSTLLEYVLREGPLPIGMNFRLQNKKNGEQLTYDGKYDFHVISSDDKQVVKEYRILPDSKITALMATSAVSINYQIRPATVNIAQQPLGGKTAGPVASSVKEEQSELIDNPEAPIDEVNGGNATQQVRPQTQTQPQNVGQVTEQPVTQQKTGTDSNEPSTPPSSGGNAVSPQVTTTVKPTVPPPPIYVTTLKPSSTKSMASNVTSKPGLNEDKTVTNPELPDDEQVINMKEAGANVTNVNVTDANGLIGEIVKENNDSSVDVTEGHAAVTNVTNEMHETNGTDVNGAKVIPESKNETVGNIPKESGMQDIPIQNTIMARPVVEKKPLIPNVNSVNPWLNVAKEVQNQQPIKWQNGQGITEAIHGIQNNIGNGMGNLNGIAPVNYKGNEKAASERPVWEYVNGEQDISRLLGRNKFRNVDQNTASTSPFKFANTKTQQELTSFYAQDKDRETKDNQRDQLKSYA